MGPISLACAIAHCMASAPTASAIEYCCISLSNGLTDSMQSRRVKQVRILTDRFDPTENECQLRHHHQVPQLDSLRRPKFAWWLVLRAVAQS